MKHTLAVILSALLVTASFSGCYGLQFLRDLTGEEGGDYEEDMTVAIPGTFFILCANARVTSGTAANRRFV